MSVANLLRGLGRITVVLLALLAGVTLATALRPYPARPAQADQRLEAVGAQSNVPEILATRFADTLTLCRGLVLREFVHAPQGTLTRPIGVVGRCD